MNPNQDNLTEANPIIVSVAIAVPLRQCFHYLVTQKPAFSIYPGMRVKVPFGQTHKIGVVDHLVTDSEALKEIEPSRLKPVNTWVDDSPLTSPSILKLYHWLRRYYHAPPGEIWQTLLPTALSKGLPASLPRTSYWKITPLGKDKLLTNAIPKNAVKQTQALKALLESAGGISHEQISQFELSTTTLKSLAGKKWVERLFDQPIDIASQTLLSKQSLTLNQEQAHAVERVSKDFGQFAAFLLFGVTASGKTEVYLQLIEQVIKAGKQALVLIPEIGLTPQTLKRFQDRFNVEVVAMHSGMTEQQRLHGWLKARNGDAKIIIGTRSAIFVPLANPGMIILDEEHDRSFRQQQGFRYSARDVALVRANIEKVPVLLGSATPSLESLQNVAKGKIHQLNLTQKARNDQPLKYRVIDLKKQVLRQGLSIELIETIRKHLSNQGQVLLFLNRRGYAPVLLCHECGWSQECKRCDVNYTYHHQSQYLQCHHCGSNRKAPKQCPNCQCNEMVPIGLGTERLEETIKQIFPEARVARIDRDTTRRKQAMQDFVDSVKTGEIDILLGTQMLAKGHHFPKVTLVGLIDMDGALYSADFRAPEYAAQLITQVSGRAGRDGLAGEVLIQTHHSEHPMLHQIIHQGYAHFAELALRERVETELPPHSYSAVVQAESTNILPLKQFLGEVKQILDRYSDLKVELLGPAPALYVKKAGKFRYQLFLQSEQRNDLHRLLDLTLPDIEKLKSARKVRWRLEIDPVGES